MKDDYLLYGRFAKVNDFVPNGNKVIFAVSGGSKAGENRANVNFSAATGCLSVDYLRPGEMAVTLNFHNGLYSRINCYDYICSAKNKLLL